MIRTELSEGCFETLLTNLPDLEFDLEEFKELYHMRWSEETSFRDIKYPLCLQAIHSKKYAYIIQEVWARAILHNFCSAIAIQVEIKKDGTRYDYQVNFAEAFRICRDFLRERKKKIRDVEGLIAQNCEAVRPGRNFARQQRFQLPISFCYR